MRKRTYVDGLELTCANCSLRAVLFLAGHEFDSNDYKLLARSFASEAIAKYLKSYEANNSIELAEQLVEFLKEKVAKKAKKNEYDFLMSACWAAREASLFFIFDRTNPWIEFHQKEFILTLAHIYLSLPSENRRTKEFSFFNFIELLGLAEQIVLLNENITKAKVISSNIPIETILNEEIDDTRLTTQYLEWETHIKVGPIEDYEVQDQFIRQHIIKEKLSDNELISSAFEKLKPLLRFSHESLSALKDIFVVFREVSTVVPLMRVLKGEEYYSYIYLIPWDKLVVECERQGIVKDELNAIVDFFSVTQGISRKMLELKPILPINRRQMILVGSIDWIQTVIIIERMLFLGNYHVDFFETIASRDIESFYNKQRKQYSRLMSFKIVDILVSKKRFIVRREGNVPVIDREKIGKLHIRDSNNQKLGDLDVCVFDNENNEVLIIECKYLKPHNDIIKGLNLESRLTPYDLEKIAQRVKWVELHLREVLEWIGVIDKNSSQVYVRCIVLTARPIHIINVPDKVKIIPYAVFCNTVNTDRVF